MTINVAIEGNILDGVAYADLFPRTFLLGDARGYFGEEIIVTVSRPFTKGEDELFRWVVEQDGTQLFGIYGCEDGRDLIVFERLYTKQTREEAHEEHGRHLRDLLVARGVTPLTFSRSM